MALSLASATITMLGGDLREVELAVELLRRGVTLRLVGYPPSPALSEDDHLEDPLAAVRGAHAVIAPMSNTDAQGIVKARLDGGPPIAITEALLGSMRHGAPFFIGVAKSVVRERAQRVGVRVIETAEIDEIATLNSIPTAEGAIGIAMAELPITLHGAQAVVVGLGRCGFTLAVKLACLGACVVGVARNAGKRARLEALGIKTAPISELTALVRDADVVFNTVPFPILDAAVVRAMRSGTLIVDLAQEPGGTDFDAARESGVKAVLALGLPGKVAPKSAGRILARTLPRVLEEELKDL